MTFELDGRLMTNRAAAHDHLREVLSLPDYYGRNLDALYDFLTERSSPCSITLHHTEEMSDMLGSYASALLKTLADAARKNPSLTITVL